LFAGGKLYSAASSEGTALEKGDQLTILSKMIIAMDVLGIRMPY